MELSNYLVQKYRTELSKSRNELSKSKTEPYKNKVELSKKMNCEPSGPSYVFNTISKRIIAIQNSMTFLAVASVGLVK